MAKTSPPKKSLPAAQTSSLLETLHARFTANPKRHAGLTWPEVLTRLEANADARWSLNEMEKTGGEPDVIGRDGKQGPLLFCDCAAESPSGRRSVCFDDEALASRKENKPRASALGLAKAMGIEVLDEAGYRALQAVGPFDVKTSSWLATPSDMRALGGALFGDSRYGRVFTYHNGAESYYAARGFRGLVRV